MFLSSICHVLLFLLHEFSGHTYYHHVVFILFFPVSSHSSYCSFLPSFVRIHLFHLSVGYQGLPRPAGWLQRSGSRSFRSARWKVPGAADLGPSGSCSKYPQVPKPSNQVWRLEKQVLMFTKPWKKPRARVSTTISTIQKGLQSQILPKTSSNKWQVRL